MSEVGGMTAGLGSLELALKYVIDPPTSGRGSLFPGLLRCDELPHAPPPRLWRAIPAAMPFPPR